MPLLIKVTPSLPNQSNNKILVPRSNTFFYSIKPLLYLDSTLGFQRISLKKPADKPTWQCFYSLCLLSITLLFLKCTAWDSQGTQLKNSLSLQSMFGWILSSEYIINIISAVYCNKHGRKTFEIISKIDENMNIYVEHLVYKVERKQSCYLYCLFIIFYIIVIWIDYFLFNVMNIWGYLFSYVTTMSRDVQIVIFSVLLSGLTKRLKILTKYSEQHDLRISSHYISPRTFVGLFRNCITQEHIKHIAQEQEMPLEKIYEVYWSIIDAFEEVVEMFKFQTLIFLATSITLQCLDLTTLVELFRKRDTISPAHTAAVCAWFLRYPWSVWLMCSACQGVMTAHKNFKTLMVSILSSKSRDSSAYHQADLLLKLCKVREPRFRVCSLFTLDMSTMLNYMALVATYLVVLLQFVRLY